MRNIFYLPFNKADISVHLLPNRLWESKITFIYSSSHGSLLIFGHKWLYHLYRHCFPDRPSYGNLSVILSLIDFHFFVPYFLIRLFITSSSWNKSMITSSVHDFLLYFIQLVYNYKIIVWEFWIYYQLHSKWLERKNYSFSNTFISPFFSCWEN